MLKKQKFRVLTYIVITIITIMPLFLLESGYCTTKEINSNYGSAPIIDGYMDVSAKEWNLASYEEISLDDLPINLWVMQDDKNLYISIQFDLISQYHNINEFVALIISNSSSENREDFIDAKIVQFINISSNEYNYLDYNINNSVFLNDVKSDGNGAAKLEGDTSTYEFSIPIKMNTSNMEDASLNFGNAYAFNISYGENAGYPSGIKKSAIVLINIKSLPSIFPFIINVVFYVLIIIVFCTVGILLGFYIYRI
ncbi:MAG: hypothetical protein ACFFDF_23290, partial [Candidatus Odinarchaeota archaeon]